MSEFAEIKIKLQDYLVRTILHNQCMKYESAVFDITFDLPHTRHFFYRNECFHTEALPNNYYFNPKVILPVHLHEKGNKVYVLKKDLERAKDKMRAGISFILRYCSTIKDLYECCPSSLHYAFKDFEIFGELTLTEEEIQRIKDSPMYAYISEQLTLNVLLEGN